MPTNVVSIANTRRHMTNAEKAARSDAEADLTRKTVQLLAPAILGKDKAARKYWDTTVERMKGISLLDDLDAEMLGTYCQIMARRDKLARTHKMDEKKLQRLEAHERLALQYAEKLGLTPSGRVRLAKKRAEERPVDPNADLYGGDG